MYKVHVPPNDFFLQISKALTRRIPPFDHSWRKRGVTVVHLLHRCSDVCVRRQNNSDVEAQSQHTVIAAELFSGQLYNQGLIKWRRQLTEAPWNEHLPNRNCARRQPRERSATRWSPAGLWWPQQSERPRVNESTLHKPRSVDREGVFVHVEFCFPRARGWKRGDFDSWEALEEKNDQKVELSHEAGNPISTGRFN